MPRRTIMRGVQCLALLLGLLAITGSASWQQRVDSPVLSIGTDLMSLTVTIERPQTVNPKADVE